MQQKHHSQWLLSIAIWIQVSGQQQYRCKHPTRLMMHEHMIQSTMHMITTISTAIINGYIYIHTHTHAFVTNHIKFSMYLFTTNNHHLSCSLINVNIINNIITIKLWFSNHHYKTPTHNSIKELYISHHDKHHVQLPQQSICTTHIWS